MLKIFKTLLLGNICFSLTTLPAAADPISIGSFVISSLLSIGAGGIIPAVSAAAIGNFVIGAAIVGASLLSSVLGEAPKIDPGKFKNTFETGESSEIRGLGRVRVGGLKAFGNTKDINRYRLICHTKGLVDGVEQHFLGGREVTVESDGSVSSPPFSYLDGSTPKSWVYIKAKVGDGSETAWPELIATFPDLWTANHRVRGIAQSLVQYISPGLTDEKFLKLYQSGAPDYERIQRCEPVYDPRDTTQFVNSPSTYKYRDNGILGAAHVLMSYPSLRSTDFNWTSIAAEANKADASVTNKLGQVEKRSRAWGIWTSETPRNEIMTQVLRSIGAEIYQDENNLISLRMVDDIRTAEITISANDIIEMQWASGPESVECPNSCRVSYYSPERNYEMTEITLDGIAWARVNTEIARVGEQIYEVDLPFCPSSSQAQRIGRRLFALARAEAGTIKTNFVGLAAWGATVANIEFPDIGETKICAIGTPRVDDEAGTVEIPFTVWPILTPWNPAVDEALPPEQVPQMGFESDLDTPVIPTAATVIQYPGGAFETRLNFTGVTDGDHADAVYRTYDIDGNPLPFAGMTEYRVGVTMNWYAYAPVDSSGKMADFKARFFDDPGDEGSYFSPTLNVNPMTFNNAVPVVPTRSGTAPSGSGPVPVTITTTEMHVASIEWRSNTNGGAYGAYTSVDIRPNQPIVVNVPLGAITGNTASIQVRARTSNLTVSLVGQTNFTRP